MNLAGSIRYWARRDPDRLAFAMGDREVSWSQLHERTSRLAQGLLALGVRHGDRVVALTPNCVEFCETVLACFKIGAIFVPLNYRLAPPEMIDIINRCGGTTLVAERELLTVLRDHPDAPRSDVRYVVLSGADEGSGEHDYETLIARSPADDPGATFPPEHPAFICYTSGTTGLPKGAVLSHRNVMATALERTVTDSWTAATVGYIPYAIAFTGGLVSMWMALYVVGAGTVLEPAFDPETTLRIIAERRITAFIAVGPVLQALAQSPDFAAADLTSLTTCATGGAPIPEELIRAFANKGINLAQQYGLTEGGGLNIVLSPDQAVTRIGSAGLPTPQCAARVVRDDGSDCDPDEVGQLILRGPQVMERYWEDPASTDDAIRDGWLHTGDLVRQDADGFIYVVDRKKDMLISGGLNVYPAEIERLLAGAPGLVECAVIAVPDPRWGEVPALVARRDGAVTEDELLELCRASLARYKVPKYVFFRDTPLPRGMSNKVLKRDLRTEYIAQVAELVTAASHEGEGA